MTAALQPGEAYDIQLPLDGRWLDIPAHDTGPSSEDEISSWAADLVADAARDRGVDELEPYRRTVLEQMYAAHLEMARGLGDDTRFPLLTSCLVPGADLMPVVTLNVSAVAAPAGLSLGDVIGLFLLPEEQRFTAPDVDQLATASGPCTRIRQLVVGSAPAEDRQATVDAGVSLVYLWPTPDDGVYLLADGYFTSPLEAEVFEPDLDAVAEGLALEPAS